MGVGGVLETSPSQESNLSSPGGVKDEERALQGKQRDWRSVTVEMPGSSQAHWLGREHRELRCWHLAQQAGTVMCRWIGNVSGIQIRLSFAA